MQVQYRSLLSILILASFLAACRSNAPAAPSRNPLAGGPAITWERDPNQVVFRADVVGGEPSLLRLNEVPECTIYGDNRIVWTDNQPNQVIVLFDFVEDITIYDFIQRMTVEFRVYTYEAIAGEGAPDPMTSSPVVEQISVNVNDDLHTIDGFSNWESGYFRDVLTACRDLSRAPALFEPSGGWLSAERVAYDPDATVVLWSTEATGISLESLGIFEQKIWVNDPNLVRVLWSGVTNAPRSLLHYQAEGQYYAVAFEVPGVMRNAPAAPDNNEAGEATGTLEAITDAQQQDET